MFLKSCFSRSTCLARIQTSHWQWKQKQAVNHHSCAMISDHTRWLSREYGIQKTHPYGPLSYARPYHEPSKKHSLDYTRRVNRVTKSHSDHMRHLREVIVITNQTNNGVVLWRNAPKRHSRTSFSEGHDPEQGSGTFSPGIGITTNTPLRPNFWPLFAFRNLSQKKEIVLNKAIYQRQQNKRTDQLKSTSPFNNTSQKTSRLLAKFNIKSLHSGFEELTHVETS
jgi:hypothetical protein